MQGDRVKEIRAKFNLKQLDLAKELGLTQDKISKIEQNKHKVSVEISNILSQKWLINPWWLLSGQGEMLLSENKSLENKDNVLIKKYSNINASAGDGVENYSEETEDISLSISFLKSFNIHKFKNLEIITAHGDSMQPTIMNKDYLLIDRSHQAIIDGHIYIFRYENEVFVKKLIKLDSGLKAISENKEYEPRIIKDVEILGKVLLSLKQLNSTYDI